MVVHLRCATTCRSAYDLAGSAARLGVSWRRASTSRRAASTRGEKVWFWGGVVVLCIVVTWSGLILLFPNFDQTRAVMQEAWIWHACGGAALHRDRRSATSTSAPSASRAPTATCATGYVDETWAKEHHEYLVRGSEVRPPRRRRRRRPAGAPHMKEKA